MTTKERTKSGNELGGAIALAVLGIFYAAVTGSRAEGGSFLLIGILFCGMLVMGVRAFAGGRFTAGVVSLVVAAVASSVAFLLLLG